MSEVILVLRSLLFATILAVILQFRVGNKTVESHVMSFAASQAIHQHLQMAANGAVALGQRIQERASSLAEDTMSRFSSSKSSTQK